MDKNVLGVFAPVMIPYDQVTRCICNQEFRFEFQKYHCNACGQIFCYDCSSIKTKIKYADNALKRVCYDCYTILTGEGKKTPRSDMRQ